ncbi:hypothetical protein TBK1r_78430 [Stieleria magnilauensis]|uniref:Uncharacterized protein n=1 Tax=Stieleria magnilauensis TaxID=2527963 RepID=A0ABX5Y3D5_9BACT|nr:hypothetical protein TBK1r_78430 [Planctomycetes bacterium TBK1r]
MAWPRNLLELRIGTVGLSDDQEVAIRKICNRLAANPMLVDHLAIKGGSAEAMFVTFLFATSEPNDLWGDLQVQLFGHSEFGDRVKSRSSARWMGNRFQDYVWIHRDSEPCSEERSGLDNRILCPECDEYYSFFTGNDPNKCPYCGKADDSHG